MTGTKYSIFGRASDYQETTETKSGENGINVVGFVKSKSWTSNKVYAAVEIRAIDTPTGEITYAGTT